MAIEIKTEEGAVIKFDSVEEYREIMALNVNTGISFPEEEESTSGDEGLTVDEDDSEIKSGDIVIATEDKFDITEGVEYEIREDVDGDRYFLDDAGDLRFVLNHEGRLRKKIIEEPKIEVGRILRCNKDSMYVTVGKLYEVLAIDRDGDAVYMDDGNSVSFVNETDIPERFEIL